MHFAFGSAHSSGEGRRERFALSPRGRCPPTAALVSLWFWFPSPMLALPLSSSHCGLMCAFRMPSPDWPSWRVVQLRLIHRQHCGRRRCCRRIGSSRTVPGRIRWRSRGGLGVGSGLPCIMTQHPSPPLFSDRRRRKRRSTPTCRRCAEREGAHLAPCQPTPQALVAGWIFGGADSARGPVSSNSLMGRPMCPPQVLPLPLRSLPADRTRLFLPTA